MIGAASPPSGGDYGQVFARIFNGLFRRIDRQPCLLGPEQIKHESRCQGNYACQRGGFYFADAPHGHPNCESEKNQRRYGIPDTDFHFGSALAPKTKQAENGECRKDIQCERDVEQQSVEGESDCNQ